MKLIEFKDSTGAKAQINPEQVFAVLPTTLIGQSGVMSPAGITLQVEGGVQEVREKLEGKIIL
jgi:hypothetical protein